MAEAILELDANTDIVETDSSPRATPSRLASRVVKISQETQNSEDQLKLASKKKLAVDNAKRKKEEKRIGVVKDGSSADQIGVAPDRGGIGSGAVIPGVPPPFPAPANFITPKVRTSRSSPRRSRSKSPSRRRTRSPSYRRRSPCSHSRSRSPGRNRRSRSPYQRRWSPVRWDRYNRSRSPRRWSPRRDDHERWRRDRSPPRGYQDQGMYRDDRGWEYGVDRAHSSWVSGPGRPQGPHFEDHTNGWCRPPPSTGPPLLSIPEEMRPTIPVATDNTLDLLKKEMLGLSQTVRSLSSQISASESRANTTSQADTRVVTKIPESTSAPPAGVHGKLASNSSRTDENNTSGMAKNSKKKRNSVPVSINLDLLQPDSEIDTPEEESSSEEEVGEELDDSFQEENLLEPEEGIMDWPSLVTLIERRFSDRIGPEPQSPVKSRITNLGGMTAIKSTERTRLPIYAAVEKELRLFSQDIRFPPVKARAKRDTKPLGRGVFPGSQRNLPLQALSGRLTFNHPAQVESDIDQLLPSGRTSYNVQGRLTEEHLRNLERDHRANLSSLSYVCWSMEFACSYLKELAEGSPDSDMLQPPLAACKHAMSYLSTVVDRSATAMATTVLARRDSYLAQMDPLIKEEDRVNLRCASFLDTRLFSGQVAAVVPGLEAMRRETKERESVNALTSIAKKSVEKQSSSSGYQKKKKKDKKFSKKKGGESRTLLLRLLRSL